MHSIVILGASGHGCVAAEVARSVGINVIGFLDARSHCPDIEPFGRLLGADVDAPAVAKDHPSVQFFVAIGDNHLRRQAVMKLQAIVPGIRFAKLIHPTSAISQFSKIDDGALVCAQASVGPGSRVGAFAIVNTRASLDHHCELGEFASLAPASATGGNVTIGAGSAIGMGAMIHHQVCVGADTVVGSLSLVNRDLPDCVLAMGSPVRVVSARSPGDKYL